jgi:hypothetical protein
MSDSEKSPVHAEIHLAVEAGDAAQVEKLYLSDAHTQWTLKQAVKRAKDASKDNSVLHALLSVEAVEARFERFIAVAQAGRNLLLKRLGELERSTPSYVGVWNQSAAPFKPNEICTDRSALWICKRSTHTRPPGDDWQLMVKAR